MATLFSPPFFTALDGNGDPLSGAVLKWFEAGTTTPTTVYSDRGLTTPAGVSVTCDSAGRAPDIWLADTISYKLVVETSASVVVRTIDFVVEATSGTAAGAASDLALRNAILNGDFRLWTAGTSFTDISGSAASVEVADRWYYVETGAADNVITRETAFQLGARYGLKIERPNTSTATGLRRVYATIEGALVERMRGRDVTLSYTVTRGAGWSAGSIGVLVATGTGVNEDGALINTGGWTGQSDIVDITQAISAATTRYVATGTVPVTATELGVELSWTPTGTAGANDWIQIEDVQVALGSSDFEARPAKLEQLLIDQDPTDYELRTASFNAASGGRYLVDTTGGAITATLPASPATGDTIRFVDGRPAGTWAGNALTIGRNGNSIAGAATDLTASTAKAWVELAYRATYGWIIVDTGYTL